MDLKSRILSFRNLFKYGSSISQNASRGIFLVFANRISVQLVNLVKFAIIARLIGPKDLGIVGIGLLTYSLLTTLTETGMRLALVQKKGDISSYLNTAFTFNFIRNLVLFVILVLISGPVSKLFSTPESRIFILAIGSVLLVDAFSNIATVYFSKDLDYRKDLLFTFTSDLSNILTTIVFAFILKSAWAIVIGIYVGSLVRLSMGYLLHPYKPKFELHSQKIRELINYSLWILLSSIVGYFILEGDDALVGILLGPLALGLYQMAYKIGNLPATQFSHVVAKVALPTYAKLQDNLEKLQQTYIMVLKVSTTITTYLVFMVVILSGDIVRIIFGVEWVPMVRSMQILLFAGWLRALGITIGPIFLGTGRPKIDAIWQVIRLIVIAVTIYPLMYLWGINGASLSVLISIAIASFGFIYNLKRYVKISLSTFGFNVVIPLINGILVVIITLFIQSYYSISTIFDLVVYVILFSLLFLGMTFLADHLVKYNFFITIRFNLRSMLSD